MNVVHPSHHVSIAPEGDEPWLHLAELAAPLALGQRALVVGPPGSGVTTVLRNWALAIDHEIDDVVLHVLLVDARAEERSEWGYEFPDAEIHATSTDDDLDDHAALADVFDEAAEDADDGDDVVIVVDTLAALAMALNAVDEETDRVLSGGISHPALARVRQCFGVARDRSDAGSVTVLAGVRIDSGIEADEIVFQELVGTGNMELRLRDPRLAPGIFPVIDLEASGARHDEAIIGDDAANARARLRGRLLEHDGYGGINLLLNEVGRLGSLEAVLDSVSGTDGTPRD